MNLSCIEINKRILNQTVTLPRQLFLPMFDELNGGKADYLFGQIYF